MEGPACILAHVRMILRPMARILAFLDREDYDLAVKSLNIGIEKNWTQICLVDASSGKRPDLLEPLFLFL